MRAVLSRKIVETEQCRPILGQNTGRLGMLAHKPIVCLLCLSFGFAHPDLMRPRLGFAVYRFRQFIEHMSRFMRQAAALATGLGPCSQSRPKNQGAITDGQFRRQLQASRR